METHIHLRLCPFFFSFQMWAIIIKSYKKKPYLLALVSTCGRLRFGTQTSSLFLLWVIPLKNLQIRTVLFRHQQKAWGSRQSSLASKLKANTETLLTRSFLARRTRARGLPLEADAVELLSLRTEPCTTHTRDFHFQFPFPHLWILAGVLIISTAAAPCIFLKGKRKKKPSLVGWATSDVLVLEENLAMTPHSVSPHLCSVGRGSLSSL